MSPLCSARLQRDKSRQAARFREAQAATIVFHRVSFASEVVRDSLGPLSGSYCILQSGKPSRPRPCTPSTPPQREASNFEQDCTRPVDGTANPWRASAELYTLSPPSPCFLPLSDILFFAAMAPRLCSGCARLACENAHRCPVSPIRHLLIRAAEVPTA
jgi:hypothetical protein